MRKIFKNTQHQKGYGLVIALLFVGFMAGILSNYIDTQSGSIVEKEAEIAGWEGAEIARAARIHSRNQIRDRADLPMTLSIPADGFGGTGPELITSAQLIASGLLPMGFARSDGTNFYNALGQTVNIYLANYPINGDPNDPATVPTAYILFEDNATTSPPTTRARVQDIVSAIRGQDVAVSAPMESTGDCKGETTIALWDTGCLNANDYDLLVDGVDDNSPLFQTGSFIIPSWRSVSFDSRAMMRFPQPEQGGGQAMLTNLAMGELEDCTTNFVQIPTATGTIDSLLCRAISDDDTAGAEIDNRRNIIGANNITDSIGLFVDPQTGQDIQTDNFGVITTVPDESSALVVNQMNGNGNGFIYGDNTNSNGLNADKNIFVSGDSGALELAKANIGILNARNSSSDILNVQNRPNNASGFTVAVSNATDNVTLLQSDTTIVAEGFNRQGGGGTPTVTVNNRMDLGDTISPLSVVVDGNTTTNAGSPYSFAAGLFLTDDLSVDELNVAQNITNDGTARVNNIINVEDPGAGVATCQGDCPKRTRFTQCTNLQNNGLFPSLGYATMQDCLDDG